MSEEKWMIFGERLKAELTKQEISYRQFAEKVGLTLTTVHRYANSQRIPRAAEILKASKALGVTCDYLLGLSDDPHKTSSQKELIPTAQPEQAVKDCRNCKHGKYNDHLETHFCYNPNECIKWNLWEPSV